jgi:hypothetical protein
MGAISSSLRGSGESWYPQVTTLGGMREAHNKATGVGIRRYRRALQSGTGRKWYADDTETC